MAIGKQQKHRSAREGVFEVLASLIFFIICFAIIFPDLFFLVRSPMGGTGGVLKDPSVSWAAFMPAFREFRYELLEHGNVLWSSLRSLGLPMLGNGVQGAPLFPLNLALVWLPDPLYWSVMPISRLILIAWGLYLVSRHIFKLSPLASLIFALLAGFNINLIRWINHPWSNGILAGIWYLYFSCGVFLNARGNGSVLAWQCCGLVVSVFAMITCGFPEASAAAAIVALMLFVGFVQTNWSLLRPSISKRAAVVLLCHVVGFCLSAVQVFALLEFISLSNAMELREGFSSGIYKADEALTFGLAQFTTFWSTPIQVNFTVFNLGLFGTFFFLRGLAFWLKSTDKPWFGIACLLMMVLYVIKSFGLSSIVESIFTHIPILAQSHFPLYFPTLFYFSACYFCAIGIESCINAFRSSTSQKLIDICVSLIAACVVLLLAATSVEHFNKIEWHGLIGQFFSDPLLHFRGFVIAVGLLIGSLVVSLFLNNIKIDARKNKALYIFSATLMVGWLLAELNHTLPKQFSKTNHWRLNLSDDLQRTFAEAANKAKLSQHELRGNEANGDYLKYGIATINNGVSAIMPVDQRRMRTNLFHTEYEGYWPAVKSLKPWSWEALSTNLIAVDTTPRIERMWLPEEHDQQIEVRNANTFEPRIYGSDAVVYLEGSTIGNFKKRSRIMPWLYFKGGGHEFWVEANIQGQEMLGKDSDRFEVMSKWRIRIPSHWLLEERYDVTVRLENEDTEKYADAAPFSLSATVEGLSPESDFSPSNYPDLGSATLLTNTSDERLHLYKSSTALPRAYVAKSCIQSSSNSESLEFLRESDAVLKGEVALNLTGAQTDDFCSTYQGEFRRVPILNDKGSLMALDSVTGPALVIVNDYYYPGWRVRDHISAESLEIIKANSIFRAVFLPESREYQLRFDYHPWWLNWVYGLLLLAMFLVLCALLLLRNRRLRERSGYLKQA